MTGKEKLSTSQWDQLGYDYWEYRSARQKWSHLYVLYPELLKQIDDLPHNTILDFGCGDGFLSFLLSQKYTDSKIYAYDSSNVMRDIAQALLGGDKVLNEIVPGAYQIICANMVVQDVSDLLELLDTLRNGLNKDGKLLISIPHPIFSLNDSQHLTTKRVIANPSGKRGYERYLFEETEQVYWKETDNSKWTFLFNRTLQSYATAFKTAGFVIENICEPLPVNEGNCEADLYTINSMVPRFLIFCLSKKPSLS